MALGMYANQDGYDYGALLDEITSVGATHLALHLALFQSDVRAVDLRAKPGRTPSPERLARTIQQAHERGLQVLLMPIVLLEHTSSTREWRGVLQPEDNREWFENYYRACQPYMRAASAANVEFFSVGSELASLEAQSGQWQRFIARARRAMPRVRLLYSANWDHVGELSFVRRLDLLGVTGYFPIRGSEVLTQDRLNRRWREIRASIVRWKRSAIPDLPLLITEIGYPSAENGSVYPWNYTLETPVSLVEQEMCYRAFAHAWREDDVISGVYFYDWFGFGGPDDRSYTPRGKPAANVIREFFARSG